MAVEYVDKNKFQEEQTAVIKTLLTNRFFNPWKEYNKYELDENYDKSLNHETRLEIFATAACNQKCEYCYLVRHEELYPREFDKRELVVNNLKVLLDWVVQEGFFIPEIEFFTGEVWHSDYGLELLDIVLDYIVNKGLQTDMLMIPSNCSFILDPVQTQKIQHYINAYEQAGVRLCFSISVDGKVVDNYRPLNNHDIRDDKYYEDLFLFSARNNYYFHPMVAACNVSQWIENYQWWEDMCTKYNRPIERLMMLEVRNEGWTDENIEDYIKFLKYLMDKDIDKSGGIKAYFDKMFGLDNIPRDLGYVPYCITFADTFKGCTVSDSLTVRLGDMAICPCHRTAYNKLLYGHFIIENNQIVDIKGNNPEFATRVLLANDKLVSPQCDTCIYSPICLKGCFGSQFESNKDPLFPIENICKLFRAKYNFVLQTHIDLGLIKHLKNVSPYDMRYPQIKKVIKLLEDFENVGKN